jgi:hypothetical protein
MVESSGKIKQRGLIVLDFGAFVNLLFLEAGIASMLPICILDPSRDCSERKIIKMLNIKDKRRFAKKYNFPRTTPGILVRWSHAFLPNCRAPWAAFWSSWTVGTVRMP